MRKPTQTKTKAIVWYNFQLSFENLSILYKKKIFVQDQMYKVKKSETTKQKTFITWKKNNCMENSLFIVQWHINIS